MDPLVLLLLAALAASGTYGLACALWPFAACRRCHGDGKLRSPGGRSWRACRRCQGSGSRLRYGRRVLNHLSTTAARGTN